MPTTDQTLEKLFARVRALPEAHRDRVAAALSELAAEEPRPLTAEELAILEPEFDGARQGSFAPREDVQRVLGEPWRRKAP